jgi:murein hydrolase activator
MKNAISLILVLFVFSLSAQTSSDALKKEQKKIEKKIENTKLLLNKVKTNTEASLNELRLMDNQIRTREELVRIFDNQVRVAEVKMIERTNEIEQLNKRLSDLKRQYKSMILYTYKHRNNVGKIMFILSANNYNDAVKRNAYLKKVAGLQKKQRALIEQHQQLIKDEITKIEEEKKAKLLALEEKKREREQIEKDKVVKQQTYQQFKKEEQKLYSQLQQEERKKIELKGKIDAAIKAEIAENQRRQRNAASKSKSSKKKNSKSTAVEDDTQERTYNYEESTEGKVVAKNFEGNRGRLPWPVEKGTITERYGRNAHPTLDGVFTNNNGIDISCSKGSSVRAIFEGEVTSVFNITGAGKVVIIKHGNYRTVYSNLADVNVSIGSKVNTKQSIGTLLPGDGNFSICHFEVHLVNSNGTQSLNPSLWIGR